MTRDTYMCIWEWTWRLTACVTSHQAFADTCQRGLCATCQQGFCVTCYQGPCGAALEVGIKHKHLRVGIKHKQVFV